MSGDTAFRSAKGPTVAFFETARAVLEQDDAVRQHDAGLTTHRAAVAIYRQARTATPSVVVVGEVGRGKSTLVNALLGHREASPTGPGETTGAYLAFQPADDVLPDGVAELEDAGGGRFRVPFAELSSWIRMDEADRAEDRPMVPLGARVGWDALPFDGARIVDTPGAGGLDADQARIALSRAATASVLLMVTDAFGVMTDSALRFLERCSEHVAAVVVVVTKIDVASDWQKVVDDDRRVLRSSAVAMVRDAPVVAVSASTRLRALGVTNQEIAARRRARSRFAELEEVLRDRLSLGDRLGRARGIHVLESGLRAVARSCELDAATLTDARGEIRATEDLARLSELRSQGATWRLVLEQRISAARSELKDEVQRRLREFGDRWQQRVDALAWRTDEDRVRRMHTDLTAELFVILDDLEHRTEADLAAAVASTVEGLGVLVLLPVADEVPRGWAGFRPHGLREGDPEAGPGDALLGLGVFRNGWMMGAPMLVLNPALAIGITAAGAAATLALQLLTKGQQLRKRNLEASIAKNVAELSAHLTQSFERRVLELRPDIVRAVERAIAQEVEQVQRRLQLAQQAARAGEQARLAAVDRARSRVTAAVRTADLGADLLRRTLSGDGLVPVGVAVSTS